MAFQPKVDYCGLIAATKNGQVDVLMLRDDSENGTNEKYQPHGQDGSFLGTEIFGADSAPTNSYGLKSALNLTAGKIKLGKIVTIRVGGTDQQPINKKFALESIAIGTSGAQAPTFSAVCQEVEDDADDSTMCHYSVPAFSLLKKHHAQVLFDAFDLDGDGCELTACSAAIACQVGKDKVAGVKIGSDVNSGVITITGTILQTGSNKPTITPDGESGWVLTKAPTCTTPESAYKSYTFELQLVLAKDQPSQQNGGQAQT